jgi:polyisoprenyl-phosphate glycosyltransferase
MSFPEVSVVIPLFDEEANVLELYRRLTDALETLDLAYELVLVNDGSRDRTAPLADALAVDDSRLVVLHLSRNFGHQAAISAGIDRARGQAVVVMDGDLQDPPEVLGRLLDTWRAGHDVVYAIRTKRKEPIWKRIGYFVFYRLLRTISDLDIPLDAGDFCLMDRKVVAALRSMPERDRFLRGLRTFVGFRQTGVAYERAGRHAGTPKYTFRRLCRLALDGLFGFSGFPLSMIAYLGFGSLLLALGLTAWACVDPSRLPVGTMTTLAALYMGALQLLGLGIIAEYLRRIFTEVKQRPTYLVARVTEAETAVDDRQPYLAASRKPK